MNKTITTIIFLVAALAAGIFLIARYSGNQQTRVLSASLSSLIPADSETFFDFGTISMANGKVSREFPMKNQGSDPLVLRKIYTSCMCTEAMVVAKDGKKYGPFGMPGHSASFADIEIGPDEDFTVEAIYDPAAHGPSGVGFNQRAIYVETNSQKTPKVELSFEANVTP